MSVNDARLQRLVRTFTVEEMIFKQGENGNSMFLVVEGLVRIYFDSPQGQLLVTVLGPGEIVGEKALLQKESYKRSFCAQAKTAVTLLEIDFETQKIAYAIWPDFQEKMFKMILQRLDKANKLVTVLQQREPVERFCAYVGYYVSEMCKNYPQGTPIVITSNEIKFGANLDKDLVVDCLSELVDAKIFTPVTAVSYTVNSAAFENFIPFLKDKVAA